MLQVKEGKQFEREVLGVGASLFGGPTDYIPYRKAMDEVKSFVKTKCDCWDCGDPDGHINDLHYYVAQALGLDDWSELKLYPCTDSNLDFWHKVDCFFWYRGNICTIDISLRNKGGYRADVEYGQEDVFNPKPLANDIAMRLRVH
jgi:hypothetical protein